MDFQAYIRAELLVLTPVMYLIGLALKKSKLNDKWIPLLLGVISIILASLWVIGNSQIDTLGQLASALFAGITQGILVAGASVFANQLYKQATKK